MQCGVQVSNAWEFVVLVYLWQLSGYPNLTVWLVVDLEPDWLHSAPTVSTRDNPLASRPIEMHIRFEI